MRTGLTTRVGFTMLSMLCVSGDRNGWKVKLVAGEVDGLPQLICVGSPDMKANPCMEFCETAQYEGDTYSGLVWCRTRDPNYNSDMHRILKIGARLTAMLMRCCGERFLK